MMPHCCCPGACLLFSDNFNRADETFGLTDSTHQWTDLGTPKFQIVSNELVCTTAGTSASTSAPEVNHSITAEHWAISASVRFYLPTNGKIRLNLFIDPLNLSSVDFLPIAVVITGGACGEMQFKSTNSSTGALEDLGDPIPVDGLAFGAWHKIRLCLDWDLDMAIVQVDDQWHHVKPVPHVTGSGGNTHFSIGAGIWVDRTITGTYKFDDFKFEALKSHHSEYGYYYYYFDNSCPECRPNSPICEDVTITFPTTDCRWDDDGLGGGCWLGSSSGIDSNGMPDHTTKAELRFTIPVGGGSVTLKIGPNAAAVTVDASGNGTFTAAGQTQSLSGIPFDTELTILACCDGDTFVATFTGDPLWQDLAEGCDGPVCVVNDGVDLVTLHIAHNLTHLDCAQCVKPVVIGSPCTGPPEECPDLLTATNQPACADNAFPKHAIFTPTPMQGSKCRKCLDWLSGIFIGDLDETFSFQSTCLEAGCGNVVRVCDGYWDTGWIPFDDTAFYIDCGCVRPTLDSHGNVCVWVGWRFIAHLQLDSDCVYRLYGAIQEAIITPTDCHDISAGFSVDPCNIYSFRSGALGDVLSPPTCPGLGATLEFTGWTGTTAAINCDFRDSTLSVGLQ